MEVDSKGGFFACKLAAGDSPALAWHSRTREEILKTFEALIARVSEATFVWARMIPKYGVPVGVETNTSATKSSDDEGSD